MQGTGYWYRDKLLYEIKGSHIDCVIDQPDTFFTTRQDIVDIYKQYNEPLGFEGKARKELIIKATTHGWIRLRRYLRPSYWSIQCDCLQKRRHELYKLVEYLILKMKTMKTDDEVVFSDFNNGESMRYRFSEGGVEKFLGEESVRGEELINSSDLFYE